MEVDDNVLLSVCAAAQCLYVKGALASLYAAVDTDGAGALHRCQLLNEYRDLQSQGSRTETVALKLGILKKRASGPNVFDRGSIKEKMQRVGQSVPSDVTREGSFSPIEALSTYEDALDNDPSVAERICNIISEITEDASEYLVDRCNEKKSALSNEINRSKESAKETPGNLLLLLHKANERLAALAESAAFVGSSDLGDRKCVSLVTAPLNEGDAH